MLLFTKSFPNSFWYLAFSNKVCGTIYSDSEDSFKTHITYFKFSPTLKSQVFNTSLNTIYVIMAV